MRSARRRALAPAAASSCSSAPFLVGCLGAVALSHYGHFFLLAVLRHGSPRHKRAVVSQLAGRVPELVAHAEGSEKLPVARRFGAAAPLHSCGV